MKDIIRKLYYKIILRDKAESDAEYIIRIHGRLHDLVKSQKNRLMGGVLLRRRYQKVCLKYGCFIPPSCELGKSLVFPHGVFGVFISQNAIIGSNCVIFQQVTIGSNTLEDSASAGSPKIGDNVYIGAGAKVIGGCNIGNNVRIGANAVVTKNIPDNVTVVGAENRIIKHDRVLNNDFIAK